MASAANDVLLHSTSEVQEQNGDVPPKDPLDSNCSYPEPLLEDEKLNNQTVLEHSNITTVSTFSRNEETDFNESFRHDHVSVNKNYLNIERNNSDESRQKLNGFIEENLTDPPVKISNGMHLPEETKIINLSISEETGSTEAMHTTIPEENGSIEKLNPVRLKETGSTEAIHTTIPEENGSIEKLNPVCLIETGSTVVEQPVVSQETNPVIQFPISDETHLNNEFQSPSVESISKDLISLSDTKIDEILPKDIADISAIQSRFPETCSLIKIQTLKYKNFPDSSSATTRETDSFAFPEICENYENGTRFIVSGSDCGGTVTASPSPLYKPIFPDFVMPPSPPTTSYSTMNSLKHSSPTNYSTDSEDISSESSLPALLSNLEDWINIGLDKVFKGHETANIVNFLDCGEKELEVGLYILSQLNKRVETLLKAAASLPDPLSDLSSGLSQSNLIRDGLNDAGTKLGHRLKALVAEIKDDYGRFVTVCRMGSKLYNGKFEVNQLEIVALHIMSNSYVKVSEDYSALNLEIGNFRNKIKDFCSNIEKFL